MPEKLVVKLQGEIAQITFNRPEAYNAMDSDVIEGLAKRFTEVAMDDAVRVVILTGAGKAFSSGADLRSLAASGGGIPQTMHRLVGLFHQAVAEMRHTPKPFIAAINGIAAGAGFSLCLACDFRVMAESAVLRQVYTSNGLCMDGGGTFSLPRLVGQARALEIAAFDKPIPAGQAVEWGLVNKVVSDGQLEHAAMDMAEDLLARSLHSYGKVKQLLERSFETSLEVQLEHERHAMIACLQHPDAAEGMSAFLEKRKPVFSRR